MKQVLAENHRFQRPLDLTHSKPGLSGSQIVGESSQIVGKIVAKVSFLYLL